MLDRAYKYNDRINEYLRKLYDTEYAKYYFISNPYYDGFDNIPESDYSKISRVSMDNDKILGLMTATISRESRLITNLSLINFTEKTNYIFSKDAISFIDYLFNSEKVESITWYACTENKKAVRIYDSIISKYADIRIAKSTPVRNAYYTNKLGYLDAYVYTLLSSEYRNKISHKLTNDAHSLTRG
ncbi:MAG: hypothetical protein M0R51_17175 [Clostridia bacterium]|jgi:hypothetical protein|nr:hypothetical protein [Clostridia bacterium]